MKIALINRLRDLLNIPFYLIHLVQLFRAQLKLPPNKAEIFDQLLITRMHQDEEHYRTTIEISDEKNEIMKILERVSLGMEILGRNYINEAEYQKLLPNKSSRNIIKHSAVWEKKEGELTTWQFEHNNFQEYIAAKVLSQQKFQIIKSLISFRPDYKKIIPSWVNTLSFLLDISKDKELLTWVLDIEPELVVKSEPDKIEIGQRIEIFKQIFNNYKEKQIWIDRDKFQSSELARFGQSNEIIDFLLSELENTSHYTTTINTIQLLSEFELAICQRTRLTSLLEKYAVDEKIGETVQNRALLVLADLKLNNKNLITKILAKLKESENDWIRYGLYYLLVNSKCLDEKIFVFIEGIKYIRIGTSNLRGESRLGDERWYLKKGIVNAKSPQAIKKILNYFIDFPKDFHAALLEKDIPHIAKNAAIAYEKDKEIYKLALELFLALQCEHLNDEAKDLIIFFEKSKTRFDAFKEIYHKKNETDDYLLVLALLADKECIEFIILQYKNIILKSDDMISFRYYLEWQNEPLFMPFHKKLNELSDNSFPLQPRRDFKKERADRVQKDISLLFDKSKFIRETKLIFNTEKKKEFTKKELIKIETNNWSNQYFSDLAMQSLHDFSLRKPVTFKLVVETINKNNWDLFCIGKLYSIIS